jgi:hypothetical protein
LLHIPREADPRSCGELAALHPQVDFPPNGEPEGTMGTRKADDMAMDLLAESARLKKLLAVAGEIAEEVERKAEALSNHLDEALVKKGAQRRKGPKKSA